MHHLLGPLYLFSAFVCWLLVKQWYHTMRGVVCLTLLVALLGCVVPSHAITCDSGDLTSNCIISNPQSFNEVCTFLLHLFFPFSFYLFFFPLPTLQTQTIVGNTLTVSAPLSCDGCAFNVCNNPFFPCISSISSFSSLPNFPYYNSFVSLTKFL